MFNLSMTVLTSFTEQLGLNKLAYCMFMQSNWSSSALICRINECMNGDYICVYLHQTLIFVSVNPQKHLKK